MANRTKFTQKKKEQFLKHLSETANVTLSARYCGVSRRTAYDHKDDDKKFSLKWDDAIEEALDIHEEVLRRRAFDGVSRPVYQGGVLVGFVTDYSDTLAMFLLKAHRPQKYRENSKVEHDIKNGGVLLVPMPVGDNDWDKAAKKQQEELLSGNKG